MVTIEFEFPVKKDAYEFRGKIDAFFSGSFFEKEDTIGLSPVRKSQDDPRDIWSFKLIFFKDKNDIANEKYIKVSGGTLDLINGSRQVWAFA